MDQGRPNTDQDNARTILLIADCWLGAIDAGRFAANLLFDNQTRIILLNTYQQPVNGASITRSIAPILKETATKDLEVLRRSLEKDYGVPSANIEGKVIEEELSTVLENNFSHQPNLSIVLGQNIHNPFKKGSCRKVIETLMQCKTRPVFLISDFITLIEPNRILIIAEKEQDVSNLYINFLKEINPGEDILVEVIAHDKPNNIKMDKVARMHLVKGKDINQFTERTPEHMFFDLVTRSAEPG